MATIKRVLIRRVLKQAGDDGKLTERKREYIAIILRRPRAMKALAEWAGEFAAQELGNRAWGDGTIVKLLLDNLDKLVAAIIAILKAWPS